MEFGRTTCERCGLPRGEGGFCGNCRVLNADPGGGLYAASGSARLTARLIDLLLFPLCLGVGWWLWLGATVGEGQSPAKRMLGLRVVRADGSPMGGGAVWFREGVAALLLTPLLPLSALWALRSPGRQALHDLLAGSVVVNAEARPAAGYERRRARASERAPVLPPAPVRRPEPARSRAPEQSGSTGGGDARPPGPVSRPVSRAPERSSKPARPHEQLPDDRPMWPGGVPPWERQGPGGASPAPRTPPPQRPAQRGGGDGEDRGVGADVPQRRHEPHGVRERAPPPDRRVVASAGGVATASSRRDPRRRSRSRAARWRTRPSGRAGAGSARCRPRPG